MSNRFVFFNAEEAGIRVTVEDQKVGWAANAADLAAILMQQKVSLVNDRVYHSSDVDFASEEGFADNDGAHEMINDAFSIFAN